MQFDQLYSGSRHNLYVVTAENGQRLMIECGIAWAKLLEALRFNLSGICGCLLSHEHKDHSKAVQDVLKAGINLYTSQGTIDAMGLPGQRRNKVLSDKTLLRINDTFQVYAFDVEHDAREPLGYIVREVQTDEYLLFATDTSHLVKRFKYPFSIIAIECSYDREILQRRVDENDINEALAKRLLTSHMEKSVCKKYLQDYCNLSKCREIHLLHCSGDNLNKRQTQQEFESELFIKTVITRTTECQSISDTK